MIIAHSRIYECTLFRLSIAHTHTLPQSEVQQLKSYIYEQRRIQKSVMCPHPKYPNVRTFVFTYKKIQRRTTDVATGTQSDASTDVPTHSSDAQVFSLRTMRASNQSRDGAYGINTPLCFCARTHTHTLHIQEKVYTPKTNTIPLLSHIYTGIYECVRGYIV